MARINNVVNKAVMRSRRASSMREREPGEVLKEIQSHARNSLKNVCEPEMEASAEPNVTVFVTVGNGPDKATGVIKGYPDASR